VYIFGIAAKTVKRSHIFGTRQNVYACTITGYNFNIMMLGNAIVSL